MVRSARFCSRSESYPFGQGLQLAFAVLGFAMFTLSAGQARQATPATGRQSTPPDDAPRSWFERFSVESERTGLTAATPTILQPLGPSSGTWLAAGPAPTTQGQVENIGTTDPVIGAIHTLVAHPTDPDVLYVGAVNGGIWKTTNATTASPTWVPLTDALPSLSISSLEMDPADSQTLLAGTGSYSSFGGAGGRRIGLLSSTDGGSTWLVLDDPLLVNKTISGVAVRGSLMLASSSSSSAALMRSLDGGSSWSSISSTGGLPSGPIFDLVGDPGDSNRFYVAVDSIGVFRSTDSGATWTNVSVNDASANGLHATITNVGNNNTEMTVASDGRLYVAVIVNGQPRYIGYTTDSGATWNRMDLPQTSRGGAITGATNATPIVITSNGHALRNNDALTISGVTGNTAANGLFSITVIDANQFSLNGSAGNGAYGGGGAWVHVDGMSPTEKPGSQGAIHFSIRSDPADPNIVYAAGDRQDSPFPNFIGAFDFSGNLWRGDTTVAPTGAVPSPQWEHLTHSDAIPSIPDGGTSNSSAPHADSREMVFDAEGNLLEVDDGGIYKRSSPRDNTGSWTSLIGDLQVTEFHDIAYDTVSDILIGGAQDTGTPQQAATGSLQWTSVSTADGGDVAVDETSVAGESTRYSSNQNLGGFRRQRFNASNSFLSSTTVGLMVTGAGAMLQRQFVTPVELNVVDPTRLIIGGSNSVYESSDQGDNITELVGPGANSNAMVYGHANNADLIYVGSGSGVFRRTAAGGALTQTTTAFPGGFVQDIAVDPADADVAYVIGAGTATTAEGVFRTTDGGATWEDVSGNLDDIAVNLRTLVYVEGPATDRLVVGAREGAFLSFEASLGHWLDLGSGLPTVPVWDLDYDQPDDILVAGTLGRGAWTIANVSTIDAPPVALCMDVTVDADANCQGFVVATDLDGGSFDPDGGSISLALVPPPPYGLGSTDVTLIVTDDEGAQDTCLAKVTVIDVTPPMIMCPADATIECGASNDPAALGFASAMDNCDLDPLIDFSDVVIETVCPADPIQEVIERTWSARDFSDNQSTCLQTITILKHVYELDIKPGSCPNSYNPSVNGVVAVALLGESGLDVSQVVLGSIRISRTDCAGGAVAPNEGPPGPHSVLADTSTPYTGVDCGCHSLTGDGIVDWLFHFRRPLMLSAMNLGSFPMNSLVDLTVSGELVDGCEFVARDCIRVAGGNQ